MACSSNEDAPRTMRDCIAERLETVCTTLANSDPPIDPQEWYDEGADPEALYHLPHAAEAFGYLEGAADMADLTVLELLWEHDLRFASIKTPRRVHATIVLRDVGSGTGRVMNRAFYDADDGSHWAIPGDHERKARRNVGKRVLIEIRCTDDQFAYPVQ